MATGSAVWVGTAQDDQTGDDAVVVEGSSELSTALEPPVKGHPSARIGVVEFTDFECPFCARYATSTHGRIERDYVDTGKVKYSVRHLPLEGVHPYSFRASEAAECAAEQGKYWQMYDQLFASPDRLAPTELIGQGRAIGLGSTKLSECFRQGRREQVQSDIAEAGRLGVNATPTLLLGIVHDESRLTVMRTIRGAVAPSVLRDVIEDLLTIATGQQ